MLVQCKTGNQLSPVVAMAYMIVKLGFAPWKALSCVAYARAQVRVGTGLPQPMREAPLTCACTTQITPPVTHVRGLCVLTERLIKREARRRDKRFAELRMASLAGV